jgi:phage baseplate assembly protein W
MPERRGSARKDTGARRRTSDALDALDELRQWMEDHDDWSREWGSRMATRMDQVESRADLLDGRAGNDDGILGTLGELRGELKAIERRQERQAKALDEIRDDVADIKAKTGAADGQKPTNRWQRAGELIIPIVVASLPVIGTIVAAYLAFKGQLASLGGK